MRLEIDAETDGMLLRTFLKGRLRLSTKMLSRLKNDEKGIVLNGERVTVRRVLHTGDLLELMVDDRYAGHAVPSPLPVEVLYEDDDLLVVNKPPDMPTHPSHGHLDDTLANALVYRFREQGIPFVFRPISRLDRNTSGAILVAKHKIAAGRLNASMQAHRIEKTYLALLSGQPPERTGRIETYIARVSGSLITRRVAAMEEEGAVYALTVYQTVEEKNGLALVSASPRTGRTHQLRVHFAYAGAPLVGDDLYGGPPDHRIARQALHARRVTFPHPTTGETVTVEAPLPADMRLLLAENGFSALE